MTIKIKAHKKQFNTPVELHVTSDPLHLPARADIEVQFAEVGFFSYPPEVHAQLRKYDDGQVLHDPDMFASMIIEVTTNTVTFRIFRLDTFGGTTAIQYCFDLLIFGDAVS